MDVQKTGKFIKRLRKEHNMSQDVLAEKVLVTRQAVSSWERGISLPDSAILLELSEIFDISIKELLLGERNEPLENTDEDADENEEKEIDESSNEDEPDKINLNKEVKTKDDIKDLNDEIEDKFLKMSNELREEYSQDIKINENLLIEKDELEKIVLDLVDKYNFKARALRKSLITLISTIIIILLLFFAYYFITSYNSISVFMITGEGNEFFTQNGIMINTKQKSYIRLGKLESFNNETIDKVELYYYDKDNENHVLYNSITTTDILLSDYYGYNEFYNYKDLENIINNLYLDIDYNGIKESIKLNVVKDFSNNLLIYKKRDKSADKSNDLINYGDYSKTILKALEEKGEKVENAITYEIEDNNESIKFTYSYGNLKIELGKYEINETIDIILNNELLITYNKTINKDEIVNKNFKFESYSNLSSEEKEIYEKIELYIEKYLLNN